MFRVWVRIIHLTNGTHTAHFRVKIRTHTAHFRVKIRTHTRHISSFFEMDKTAGAYSLQLYDYLSQIQLETKEFLLIVRHITEGLPISDWQWHHRMNFFFAGFLNRVNLVLFLKPWFYIIIYNVICWGTIPIATYRYELFTSVCRFVQLDVFYFQRYY